MALTGKVSREYVGNQDEISGVFTDSDSYFAGGILAVVSGKLKNAATAQIQQIAGIFTGKCDDGDSVDEKVIGASNTIKGIVKRGKVWLPHTGAAQTDVGLIFVNSADDQMDPAPATATTTYYGYEALEFKTGYLLFDLRNVISVTNES